MFPPATPLPVLADLAGSAASSETVAMAFVRSAVRALSPAQCSQALTEAGIAPHSLDQPGARVAAASFARLWIAIARLLDDEFFGLDSRRMKVGTFAMLCHALAGQRQIGSALKLALRGFGLCFDGMGLSLRVGGGMATVVISNRISAGGDAGQSPDSGRSPDIDLFEDARRFADETLLVMLYGLLCWLAGRRVPLARLDWGHPAPPHADEYRRMFSPLIRFDAAATAIVFDAQVMQAASAVTPASLKAFLRDAPQSVFLKQVAATGLSDRARRLCRVALDRGDAAPTLAMLAAALRLSPATLRRRLEDEGSSWGHLKDEVRRDLALQHLAEARLSVVEIAASLGFNDASTFYRAFRKWTGCAPGAWRSEALARVAAASDAPARLQPSPRIAAP